MNMHLAGLATLRILSAVRITSVTPQTSGVQIVTKPFIAFALLVMLMLGAAAEAQTTAPLDPKFRSAITKQLSPAANGEPALIELTTVVTYPYSLDMAGIDTIEGNQPLGVTENVAARSCPESAANRPGGLACKQRFLVLFPYNVCGLSNDTYRLRLKYTTPGQADPVVEFTLSSENWCQTEAVPANAPQIWNMSPNSASRGQALTLVIEGTNFATNAAPVVRLFTTNLAVKSYSSTQIVLELPASVLQNYVGLAPIRVLTGAGASNVFYLQVR